MNLFRNILRILTTIAAFIYTLIFIDEAFPPYNPDFRESNFGIFMVFLLYAWFLIGYYYLWNNEKKAGIFLTTWWILLFLTAWLIWSYGNVTVILGFPIFILGILLLIYSYNEVI
ncbi:hypothetical protein [Snuella sedimenti]|uniref:Uncharacterized protein n=1 Tax=Snuella sedimenti TaxID=2798802 RepID=A0A8J7IHC7_9FLAO|nr:hypothetical protein [Snuella sedimenti]MBJ6367861.1 hypothetical protein [Snuella sedimenti]